MRAVTRWEDNWRVVAPPSATRVDLPRSPAGKRAAEKQLRGLPAGSPVVLAAGGPGAGARNRRVAARARVAVERNYLAFPSASAPAYLIEDTRAAARHFVQAVLVVPPHSARALPLQALLRLLRSIGAWRFMRVFAPGRVAVGRRT